MPKRKKAPLSFDELRKAQYDALFNHWIGGGMQDDHTYVLLGQSLFDIALKEALRRVLIGPEENKERLLGIDAPLGSFGSRIDAGLAIGLYGIATHKDLHIIRDIRNHFAHYPTIVNPHRKQEVLTFKHNTIANLCRALTAPERLRAAFKGAFAGRLDGFPKDDYADPLTNPKDRFDYTLGHVSELLLANTSPGPLIEIDTSSFLMDSIPPIARSAVDGDQEGRQP